MEHVGDEFRRRLRLLVGLWCCLFGSGSLQAEPVTVLLELIDPPTVQVYASTLSQQPMAKAAATALAQQRLSRLEARQKALLPRLTSESVDARILYRLQRVLNGIVIQVSEEGLDAIRAWPEVAAVHELVPKHRATATSVPFVGVPAQWDALGLGLLGSGISIGIVDTGVDYVHADFGGSGLAADYIANDPTSLADGLFPNAKVVGGTDFVGDNYDAANPLHAVPIPDPDPMDCDGHGTHVAGIAAGLGVSGDGSTFAGSYDPAISFSTLRVGPGVAPGAEIYALRVFGCTGTTAVVEQAIEWAVDPNGDGDFSDHLDVLNLSLTAPFSNGEDPTSIAANNAALAGVVVVAAAGNDGQTHFINGSPAVADHAIGVAVIWDDDLRGGGVRVTGPPTIAATHQAAGAAFGTPLTSPGLSGEVALTEPANACAPLTNGAAVTGKIALADRTEDCSPVTQVRNVQDAGAMAMILGQGGPSLSFLPNDGTGGDIAITAVAIRQAAAELIRGQLPGLVEVDLETVLLGDMFGSFSSRGPRRSPEEVVLKPDVAAPGVAIASAGMGDVFSGGVNAAFKSGTSMATPHVSGLAALLLEQQPARTPAQIKALIMNTSSSVYFGPEQTPPIVPPSHMGAGRIEAAAAVASGVIAYQRERPERVSLGFGHHEVRFSEVLNGDVRLENLTGSPATYELSLESVNEVPGVQFLLPVDTSIVVPAMDTRDVTVRVDLDPTAMRHVRSPAIESVLGFDLHWLSQASAFLLLTPTAGAETVPLRVPLHISARPASRMSAAATLDFGADLSGTTSIPLAGNDVSTDGLDPESVTSRVTPFEWQQHLDPPVGEVGRSDLSSVGVTSDFPAQPGMAETTLFFAIASHGASSSPQTVRYEIAIDVDRNGSEDFVLFNSDEASHAFDLPSDAFISVLQDLGTNGTVAQESIDGQVPSAKSTTVFQNDTMILSVRAADLGLADGASRFDYRVRSFDRGASNGTASLGVPQEALFQFQAPISETLVTTYDPAAPGVDFSGGMTGIPSRDDLTGASVPVVFDIAALLANRSLGVLLVHHHNASGRRAQTVELLGTHFPDIELAITASSEPVLAGAELTYSLTAVNRSSSFSALNVRAALSLPAEVTFLAPASAPECADVGGGLIDCDFGGIGASSAIERQVVVQVDRPLATGTSFSAEAVVESTSLDPITGNDTASVLSTITSTLLAAGFETGTLERWTLHVP